MAVPATRLAFDDEGFGTPVVLVPGLTSSRRTWRPIIDQLDGSVRSIAIDLAPHGDSGGAPASLDEVAATVHELLEALSVERPVVVGHSMSGGVATSYATTYPSRGIVVVDNGPDIRPFAELVQRLEPALRAPGFPQVWRTFEQSFGLERIPEPTRSLVLDAHEVKQDVVVGYWEMALRTDPTELQAFIDRQLRRLDVPFLGVFGRRISDGERERFQWLTDFQLEEWTQDGHFVHLVDPARFANRLRVFVQHCTASQP